MTPSFPTRRAADLAGSEWVLSIAESDGSARIALVGATLHEARSVMVEGESGLLAIAAQGERPVYAPSLRRLVWRSGAQAMLYGAAEPDRKSTRLNSSH